MLEQLKSFRLALFAQLSITNQPMYKRAIHHKTSGFTGVEYTGVGYTGIGYIGILGTMSFIILEMCSMETRLLLCNHK